MEFIPTKTIISSYNENPHWFGINYNMNIYKGCCHGCIYCDSRSNCYQILDFDRVRIKENSIETIKKELQSKIKKGVVGTGAMSDPYNPFEKEYELTREALKIVDEYRFGIGIATKSNLITRDIDILKKIQSHSPVIVKMTITTFDDELCKKIERKVCTSEERFKAIKELSDNNIYTGVLLMPLLPFINDNEDNIKNIIRKVHECGGKFIFTYGMGVTLRNNQREYYFQQLRKIFPRENLDKIYMNTFGDVYENTSPNATYLWKIFKSECEKYNILYKMEDIIRDYKHNYERTQITWF